MFISKPSDPRPLSNKSVVIEKDKTGHCPQIWGAIKPVLSLITTTSTVLEPSRPITRKEKLRQSQLIQDHSQLSKPTGKVVKRSLESPFFKKENHKKLASVLGHIHGDQIIENSPLERLPPHVGAQVLQDYLEEKGIWDKEPQKLSALHEVMTEFKQTAERIHALEEYRNYGANASFYTCATDAAQAVYKLEPGKSYILGGQGAGHNRLEHSVLFEFHKNLDGTYDLFVYVMDKHKSTYDTVLHRDRRDWVRPFMHYRGILPIDLFFNGSNQTSPQIDLFQAILEPGVLKEGRLSFSPEYLASKLLAYLHQYKVPANQELSGFISAARSHPDAWHPVKAIALRYLGKEDYKRFVIELKFRSLVEGYQLGQTQLQHDTVDGAELRTVLKRGTENLLRQLVTYQRKHWLSEERCVHMEATALDLQQQIAHIEGHVDQGRRKKIVALSYVDVDYTQERQAALQKAKETIHAPRQEKISIRTEPPQIPKLWAPKRFASDLSTFVSKTIGVADIEHLVAQFPIPESPSAQASYWNSIPKKELNQVVSGLQSLMQKYDLTMRQRDLKSQIAISPHEANTVYTIYVVLHFIALRIDREKNSKKPKNDPSCLESYPIFFPGVLYDSDPYHTYTSPEDFKKRQQISAYMRATGTDPQKNALGNMHAYGSYFSAERVQTSAYGLYATLLEEGVISSNFRSSMTLFDRLRELIPHLSPMYEDIESKGHGFFQPKMEAGNAFKKADRSYLPSLFYAAFVAYQFSGYTHLRNDDSEQLTIKPDSFRGFINTIDFSAGRTKFKDYPNSNQGAKLAPISDKLHPQLIDPFLAFPKRDLARRQRYSKSSEEGDILNDRYMEDHKELLRSCCEPSLQPHQMLYYYRSRFDLFAGPEEQTLFEIEFFRTVLIGEERFPLKEELEQKGFVNECRTFIQEGVERYFYLQLGGRPHVFATLFFLRLASRLARFTGKPLFHSLPYVEKMLQLDDLTAQEKSALCLHKVLVYSTENKELSDLERKDLFRAWIYHKNTPLPPEWKNRLLEKEVAAYLHTQLPTQNLHADDRRAILNEALLILEMPSLTDGYVIDDLPLPTICAHSAHGESWEINLLTGKVCNQLGILVRGAHPPWIPRENRGHETAATTHFNYLFGGRVHNCSQTGTTIYFQDPCFGSLRVINEDIQKGLQRQIGGQWTQYVPPKTLEDQQIPRSLLADHTHWVPVGAQEQYLWICDFKTGKQRALLTQEGEIHPCNGTPEEVDSTRTLQITPEKAASHRMDDRGYILGTKHKGILESVSFTRFQSLSGEPLYFDMEPDGAVYGLNKKYILSPEQKEGLLEGISQYLLLRHKEEAREKVLIPCRKLSMFNPLSPLHTISTQTNDNGYGAPQQGVYTFLEFDIKGDKLIPLSIEGTFYLAYLKLAQREYLQAKELLNKIDFRQPLSLLSTKILVDLIQICEGKKSQHTTEPGKDHSPAAAAVVLAAYRLVELSYERMGKQNPCESPHCAKAIYQRNLEIIPAGLELSIKTEEKSFQYSFSQPTGVIDGPIHPLSLKLPQLGCGFSENKYPDCHNYHYAASHTDFIREEGKEIEKNVLLSTKYGEGYTHKDNNFFRSAYILAKTGSVEERKQLAFRLHIMEQMRMIKDDPKLRPNAWSLLHFALRFPDKAPELPPLKTPHMSRLDDVLQAWGFLQNVNSLILASSTATTQLPALELRDPPGATSILKAILPASKKMSKAAEPLTLRSDSKETIDGGFIETLFSAHLKPIILKTAVRDGKVMQNFDLESLLIGGAHSQTVKGAPNGSDSVSKDCVNLPSPTAVFRIIREENELEEITFAYDPAWARSEDEKSAEKPIKAEFDNFQKDYAEGRKNNQNRQVYEGINLPNLQQNIEDRSKGLATDLHNLETTILEIANKMDPQRRAEGRLLRESKVENELSMKKLIGIFLTGDRAAFKKANPYLAHPDYVKKVADAVGIKAFPEVVIDYLYDLIGLYLTTGVYRQRLERAFGHCKDIAQKPMMSDLEKEDLVQKIASELNPKRLSPYDVPKYPVFLVYEYLSGLAIRPEQVVHLEKMLELNPKSRKYRNRVAQLIMGGGKTTLIGVILLKLAASEGNLALFITPGSQYSSVAHNLRRTQKEYFDQDMEEIDIPGDQIYAKGAEIERRMRNAMEAGDFLLAKSETLLCIHLKFITACFEGNPIRLGEINALRHVLLLLRQSGEALIDEVDLVLNILQEMNVPMGEEQHVDPSRIEINRELFSLLISEDAATSPDTTANLRELIGLESNRQTLLKESDFKEIVAQAVAWKFVKKYPTIQDYFVSFYRYISGKMNTTCQKMLDMPGSPEYLTWEKSLNAQDTQDLAFLTELRSMRNSKDKDKEEAVHQIAVIKLMLRTVLPTTFQKMGNRHYGRGVDKPGEVRPFLASDVPSTNHFGYIYEWIAHHFQTVLQCGIKAPQLKALADLYREGAEGSLKAKHLVWDETSDQTLPPEAYEFKQMTGVDLDLIDKPGMLEKALANLQGKNDDLLKLEAETASSQVVYHPYRVTANGMTLVNMLNARVMSATPHNAHCYEDCLSDGYKPEWGIEGGIADVALERVQTEEKIHVHLTRSRNLSLLSELLDNHTEKKRIRMFMDSGALLKDSTNLEVAKALRDKLGIGVLFFMRDPKKKNDCPDTLALLPLDSDRPRIIGGTRLEDIEKTGLSLQEYCVYADERHTTGTDVPLPFDAIGMMTVDETMLRRSFFQTMLRLRQFFAGQRIEYVIPEDLLPTFPTSSAQHKQLMLILRALMGSIRNQAICKGKHYFRSRKQKIDSLFEQTLLTNHLLIDRNLTLKDLEQIGPYKKVMLIPQNDLPYDQFGALEYSVSAIADLERHGAARVASFREGGGDEQTALWFEEEIRKVIQKAAASQWMIDQVPSPGVNELGMEVDILNEVNQNVEKNVEQEIDVELLKELQMYQDIKSYSTRDDTTWKPKDIEALLTALLSNTPLPVEMQKKDGFTPLPLQELFDQKHYSYKQDFSSVFDAQVQVTKTWAFTNNQPLPVFHCSQRPAGQVLVFQAPEGYRALLLSQKEAGRFKAFLHEQYKNQKWKDVWLLLPDMSPYEDNPFAPPPREQISDLFVQINALNGNVIFLECHPAATQLWLHNTSLSERKVNFLKLRVGGDPVKKRQFFESKLFGSTQGAKRQIYSSRIRDKIASLGQQEIRKLGIEDKEVLRQLSDNQLRLVTPEQVPLLTSYQIGKLRGKALIQSIPSEYKNAILPDQFSDLSEPQVKWFAQDPIKTTWFDWTRIPDMTESQRESLCDTQVESITTPEIVSLLPPAARAYLTGKQIQKGLVPQSFIPDLRRPDAIQILPIEQLHLVTPKEPEKSIVARTDNTLVEDEFIESSDEGISEMTEESSQWERCKKITGIACFVLATIAFIGASILGTCSIIGLHASWAPKLLVDLSHVIGPEYVSYILTAAGPAYLFCAWIGRCIQKRTAQQTVIRA